MSEYSLITYVYLSRLLQVVFLFTEPIFRYFNWVVNYHFSLKGTGDVCLLDFRQLDISSIVETNIDKESGDGEHTT